MVPLDASELSTGLASEERAGLKNLQVQMQIPYSWGEQEDLRPATRSAKHPQVATGTIHFFMCKCTHTYVNLHIRLLCGFCVHVSTHWEQLLSFATGRN